MEEDLQDKTGYIHNNSSVPIARPERTSKIVSSFLPFHKCIIMLYLFPVHIIIQYTFENEKQHSYVYNEHVIATAMKCVVSQQFILRV